MIAPRVLAPGFAVTGQVRLGDLPEIAAHYRALINNRPDDEEPGQPSSADLETAARGLGLDYTYIPISGEIADKDVAAFVKAILNTRGPTLAFCRTGNRSASVWALSQRGKRSAKRILAAAANAGYDLGSLEPRLLQTAPVK
ncbi:MAG: TIGR01244 family sulfur transferase [Myxococcales bacterium]|jgi:sulfide:quinone oxidoreductase